MKKIQMVDLKVNTKKSCVNGSIQEVLDTNVYQRSTSPAISETFRERSEVKHADLFVQMELMLYKLR
jgi:hypothetical protein